QIAVRFCSSIGPAKGVSLSMRRRFKRREKAAPQLAHFVASRGLSVLQLAQRIENQWRVARGEWRGTSRHTASIKRVTSVRHVVFVFFATGDSPLATRHSEFPMRYRPTFDEFAELS